MRSTRATRGAGCAALVVTLLACGASGHDTRPATDDDFRAIQRAEAAAERGLRDARDSDAACDAAQAGANRSGRAHDAICTIAEETADLDARARCRSATDVAREAESAWRARCGAPE